MRCVAPRRTDGRLGRGRGKRKKAKGPPPHPLATACYTKFPLCSLSFLRARTHVGFLLGAGGRIPTTTKPRVRFGDGDGDGVKTHKHKAASSASRNHHDRLYATRHGQLHSKLCSLFLVPYSPRPLYTCLCLGLFARRTKNNMLHTPLLSFFCSQTPTHARVPRPPTTRHASITGIVQKKKKNRPAR